MYDIIEKTTLKQLLQGSPKKMGWRESMNQAFNSIKKGLEQAIQHAAGKGRVARVHRPVPVSVRNKSENGV
jgi:hypothetical protein